MTQQAPKVSVVIAAYRPGEAVRRVIDSLDAQTLPQDEFEVIFVDDGSGDGTYEQLQGFAATRPNMQVHTIPNSGWPSRPRNVGIGHARGEYLLFMDHDDSLYPDGLRRAYTYAAENGADVLSPKESKTNDVWWGMSSLTNGNLPNALLEEGIHRMLPMVPHKLYRRQMFMDHDIRFPEGARVLWEDWFINLDAFRWSKVVSVMADSPMYLWHASDTNSSHTFSPSRVDFWDRLEDMMAYIASALSAPEHREARTTVMAHQVQTRVVDRCVRLAAKPDADPDIQHMALARARELIARYTSDAVYARLPMKHRAQLYLMRAGRLDLMRAFHEADLALGARASITSARWDANVLSFTTEARWEPKKAAVPGFRTDGTRTLRAVSADLERAIPPELLDLSDAPSALVVDLCVRSRAEYVTWAIPFEPDEVGFRTDDAGTVSLVQTGAGVVRFDDAALGAPLDDTVWDVRMRTEWVGMERKGPLQFRGTVMPALTAGRPMIAYSNASKGLTVDLVERLRTLALDADPADGPAGPIGSFSAPLTNVTVHGTETLDASGVAAVPDAAVPEDIKDAAGQAALAALAGKGGLGARIVVDGDTARLEGGADLPAGSYALFARRAGVWHPTKRSLVVAEDGQASFGRR